MAEEQDDNRKPEDNTPAPEPGMSDEAKDFIIRTVNAAVGGRSSRMEKKLEDLVATMTKTPDPEPDKGKKSEDTLQLQQMQAKLAEYQQKFDEQTQLTRENARRDTIRQAFERNGVTGPRARAAMAMLYTEDKTIREAEDGNLYFFAKEDGVTERVPLDLDDGLKRFLGSSEGKMFLPAKDVGGSGSKGATVPKTGSADDSLEDLLMALGEGMLNGDKIT